MHKRMGCKADGADEYRSNLVVVRISSRRPTQQAAFYAPRYKQNCSFSCTIFASALSPCAPK